MPGFREKNDELVYRSYVVPPRLVVLVDLLPFAFLIRTIKREPAEIVHMEASPLFSLPCSHSGRNPYSTGNLT